MQLNLHDKKAELKNISTKALAKISLKNILASFNRNALVTIGIAIGIFDEWVIVWLEA